jgi:hypothetical protein
MGLLKHLLFWPVTGPEFLVRFAMEKVSDVAREQLTDDQAVKEDLLALQMEVELGTVSDEEYAAREAALMDRLREVRAWREEFGMGISGGPVRVASSGAPPPSDAEDDGTDADDAPPQDPARGGIASGADAVVEISVDWDDPEPR